MNPRSNPFVPGAGVRPPEFAGRDDLIEQAEVAFDRTLAGLYANSMILLGLRGVGKTVLLNHLHEVAKAKSVETARIEVPDGSGGHLARLLVPLLDVILRRLNLRIAAEEGLRRAGAILRNFASVFRVSYEGFEFGASPATVEGATGNLEADLPELVAAVSEAARARGTAVGVFVDEIQYLSETELSALARVCHDAAQRGFPFLLVGAGLPQIAALAGEAKSYAERLFLFPEVGALDPAAARRVIAEPAIRQGVRFGEDALDRIVEETSGYPYFLQTWGKFAWDEAEASPVTADDVARAGPAIRTYLDQHFFRVRFDRCSVAEQHYLRAMAELGPGPHRTGDIAQALGVVSSSRVATIRRNLIESGMIYSQRHGETAFTVPLFDTFMRRAIPVLEPYSPRRRSDE